MENNNIIILEKKINDLNKIIAKQDTIIKLLIERLTNLANDFDNTKENSSINEYGYSHFRTDKWEWK